MNALELSLCSLWVFTRSAAVSMARRSDVSIATHAAHVDHGKTTLFDSLLRACGVSRYFLCGARAINAHVAQACIRPQMCRHERLDLAAAPVWSPLS